MAADPLFLQHAEPGSSDTGAVEADLALNRAGMQGGACPQGPVELQRSRIQLARHRRSGPRRGCAADLWISYLGAVRDSFAVLLGVARRPGTRRVPARA